MPINPRVYAIVDMEMIWRMSTPAVEDREKADATVYNWGILSPRLSILLFPDSASRENIMVHDPYNFLYFIKDNKRERRKFVNSKSVPDTER